MTDSLAQNAAQSDGTSLYSPLVEKAFRVAADAHRNQTRKASDLPYFQHPASVTLILARAGFDNDDLLAAAVLHDTIEDTDCTAELLTAEFSESVVDLVLECSEQKTDASGAKIPWRARKEGHIAVVREASPHARAIVLADKLHNLGSMVYDLERGEELWSRFNASPEELIWYHREIVATATTLPAVADSLIVERINMLASECQRLIDHLADSVPSS
ncbi:MAG: (p)ppGpp synthase/HD superfamily hydrolase [Planctomycetaceae bacterium]|jgi:(p)ppGpp synthase/HD superfamily hydrolase